MYYLKDIVFKPFCFSGPDLMTYL